MKITYDRAERWYWENEKEAREIIQSSFLIDKTLVGHRVKKVDMTRGYMKDDIGYAIVLLRKFMGLPIAGHLYI